MHLPVIDARFRNADWPDAWEKAFWRRANHVIRGATRSGNYGNNWFENEKRSYGWAMLSILGGHQESAVKFLQAEDAAADKWNRHTLGIDYFPCFTLKHQMRKYFFFEPVLDSAYRERMKKAARIFTEKDPLRRPHYAYTGKGVWGPDGKNSWVDVRSTDNLKLMRDTSVYLLAEEAGNEATRRIYEERLIEFVVTMFYAGMGEWDSENYLGHSMAPVLNLYDFAKDPDVRLLAKAALDWMAAASAVKYWRGAYNGPTRRDYNHPYPFGGSAPALTWLWFGDAPHGPHEFESDEIHVITSAYRPPAAVVHLARKNFQRPVEIIAGKPEWAAWKTDAEEPSFRETHYIGKTFQLGTLLHGSQEPDINGFKMLTYSSTRGADTTIAGPVSDPLKLGSVQYQKDLIAKRCAVAQSGNVAIYVTRDGSHPFLWLVPKDVRTEKRGDVTFLRYEKTTAAIWPIRATAPRADDELTELVQVKEKKVRKGKDKGKVERSPRWVDSRVLRSEPRGDGLKGFTVEVDEGDPKAFLAAAAKIAPELDGNDGVSFTGVGGRRARVRWGSPDAEIEVWRDGEKRDFSSPDENVAYRTLGGHRLIEQSWQGDGTLRVEAGGKTFVCTVTRDGKVAFRE